jgi:hypothetical protein
MFKSLLNFGIEWVFLTQLRIMLENTSLIMQIELAMVLKKPQIHSHLAA